MTNKIDPKSPLVNEIKSILRQNEQGLSVPEIRRKLLLLGRFGLQESDIEKIILLNDFARLPGGNVVLEELRKDPDLTDDMQQYPSEKLYSDNPASIINFPENDNYIIFDFETNGIDPNESDFFQLSAIKVIDGQPKEIFNEYAKVDLSKISRTLQLKLHFDDLHLKDIIASAPFQKEVIDSFIDFSQGLPLFAHNGYFDYQFLLRYSPEIANPIIDTLELFVLTYPTRSSHSIESLAEDFGYRLGGSKWGRVLELDEKLQISPSLGAKISQPLFHSALFDCLILYLLIQNAISELSSSSQALKSVIREVSPMLAKKVGDENIDLNSIRDLSEIISLTDCNLSDSKEEISEVLGKPLNFSSVKFTYGALLKYLGFEPRKSQLEMMEKITDLFNNSGISMIEAPTGTGKTYAYLFPAIMYSKYSGQQIKISTSTKTLQDQILYDLENNIKPNFPLPFKYAVLKGQDNYLCVSRLWDAFQEVFLSESNETISPEEKLVLLYFLRFADKSFSGDLQEVSFWFQKRFPIVDYYKSSLCSERETCNFSSKFYPNCFYPQALERSKAADLLIINHALLLMRRWEEGEPSQVIVDEAHNLEDVATDVITDCASRTEIEHLLNRLFRLDNKRGTLILSRKYLDDPNLISQALGSVRKLRLLVAEFGGYLKDYLEKIGGNFSKKYGITYRLKANPYKVHHFAWQYADQIIKEILRELASLQRNMSKISESLSNYVGKDKHLTESLIKELYVIFEKLFYGPDGPGQMILLRDIPKVGFDPLVKVHWIDLSIRGNAKSENIKPEDINWSFNRAPVRVGEFLQSKIYSPAQVLVLTSATLTLGESGFRYFMDRLGLLGRINPPNLVKLTSPFNYDENVMLGLPAYLKSTARYDEIDAFQKEIAQELRCFFNYTEGRGLVLFTARSRMEFVAKSLEKSLSHLPILWQRLGTSTSRLQEEFVNRDDSILLGLRSFWEGVDIPGPSLSYLVIEKLPFPVPKDPIIESRMDELKSKGGNEWSEFLIPIAALKFKQGFGRLMRKHDDRGVVIFLDKRFRSDAFYRGSVLGSLPGYKRSEELMDAEESRLDFYKEISGHMASVFPDLASRIDLFSCIREQALPEIEKLIRRFKIPQVIADQDYPIYRENLLAVAQVLINDFENFRPEQDEAMKSILTGNNTFVVLPTGSGKSLTFQLPALLRDGITLVFSPLIALMRDQVEQLKSNGLTIVDYIVSGQSGAHRDEVYRRMVKGQVNLVYIAPERIRDPALIKALKNSNITQIVVDEAHCIYMWGNSFRPDFLKIPSLFIENCPPIAAMTATASIDTRNAIVESLNFKDDYNLVTRSVDRLELKFIVYNKDSYPEKIKTKRDKWRVLLKILTVVRKNDEVAIIYTSTVHQAEYLSRLLNLSGFSVRHYHGRMQAQEREEIQYLFREGIVRIIIATKAFGMGIDKSDVRYVIHYDVPGDIESYFQEAGRAGRDGKTAYCILLYHKSDLGVQKFFIENSYPQETQLNNLLNVIRDTSRRTDPILINPSDLADQSGIDVERLDLALHFLEKLNYINRSFNFTLKANVLLSDHSPEWISERLDCEQRNIFNDLIKYNLITNKFGQQIDLLDLSQLIDQSPIAIDDLLIDLASKGWAVYRPWDRGYIIEPLERLLNKTNFNLDEINKKELEQMLRRNLRRIINYAEGLGVGECRRAFLLEHFGEKLSSKPAPCCNLCHPNEHYPWSAVGTEQVPDISEVIDPNYITLRIVGWNSELFDQPKLSPYTKATLTYILSGNTYAATHFIDDPKMRSKRIQRLENAPYFGALQGIYQGEKKIESCFKFLDKEGYITEVSNSFFTSENEFVEYQAPILTPKGLEIIQTGKYLNN